MKKIKAGLLIDEFFGGANTPFGGYGFLARNYITKYIPNNEIEIEVLLELKEGLEEIEKNIVDGINVYRLPQDKEIAKKWLDEQKYDLFLSIELTYPSAWIAKLIDDKKLILWIQDPRPNEVWQEKRNSMEIIKDPCVASSDVSGIVNSFLYRNSLKLISQGMSLNPLAKMLYNLPDEADIQYLPNPIELDLDYEFNITEKKKQVIFLGRLEAQKRVWLFCEIAKRMPDYEFYVMGKFHRHEEENRKTLENYMGNDIPNLHFVGHLEGEEKEKLIKESRLLLNTSIWEGIPISWLEALQYGTLIVSCLNNETLPERFGAYVGEILGDGFGEVDKFIEPIKKLMENDEKYSTLANSAINYIRKNHNIEKFQKDIREVIEKTAKEKSKKKNLDLYKPYFGSRIDVKITYNCNFKCEYCYQADENGVRQKGFLSHEHAKNLVKFIKRVGNNTIVTLAGGEPFIYPDLEFLGKEITKLGNQVSIITNFSAPLEKIKNFFRVTDDRIECFSISLHLSQWKNLDKFYEKLTNLLEFLKHRKFNMNLMVSCVVTNDNFHMIEEVYNKITKEFNLKIDIQRYYDRNGKYVHYNPEAEALLAKMKIDVPEEKANNIDFYKKLCWAGAKFFYIEHNGDVMRCYTQQENNDLYVLGNLSKPNKIQILNEPTCCLSNQWGNCVCHKHFERQKIYLGIDCNEIEYEFAKNTGRTKNHLKYHYYRFISNFVFGKTKDKLIAKKHKYRDR